VPFPIQKAAGLTGTTGPVLLLFPEGVNDPQISSATMTSANGAPVEVKWVDGDTPAPPTDDPYLPWDPLSVARPGT